MHDPSPNSGAPEETRDWYRRYYAQGGSDRNDLLKNPGVLFQTMAMDAAVIRALGGLSVELPRAKVLDVGCGTGGSLHNFVRLGFPPENLHGIDLLEERIRQAKAAFPTAQLTCGDAGKMTYLDHSFDVTFESTMFVQITDETIAAAIAREMIRVTKVGGTILLLDWRYSKPWNKSYRGLSRSRIRGLFDVGRSTRVLRSFNGALIPPLGRVLSRRRFQFVLCGLGDRFEEIRALAKACPSVLFPGFADQARIWTLLRLSSAGIAPFLSTSNYTGHIPNKIVEYLSAGLPIVSSLKGTVQSLLAEHQCGLFYENGDSSALAAGLIRLQERADFRRVLSANALRLFQQKFTAAKVFSELSEYLAGIVRGPLGSVSVDRPQAPH